MNLECNGREAMTKKHLLFDLDGTLTNPKEGITKSVQYALNAFGIKVENRDELCPFIGPPLKDSFMEFYNFSEEDAKKAVLFYREYFREKGMLDNKVYVGVEEVLSFFVKQGKKLYVASSKPEIFVRKILEHFELDSYFIFMGGADLKGTRDNKADVIRYVMEECGLNDRSSIVMIGDRKHDILGAKEVSIDSVGVLYGFGSRQELEAAGAEQIAETIFDLQNLL
jgi:phosphoglycolate phosphatase